jgi:GxxExxY protein
MNYLIANRGIMTENDLATVVLDASIFIHKKLGPGLLESIYESILAHELQKKGLLVERQVPLPVIWDGEILADSFRADLIIDRKLLIEIKATDKNYPVYKKQVLTYLKVSELRLGLLINFGSPLLKDGIERVINGYL